MPRLDPEALLFCAVWAAVALAGGLYGGWAAGAALSVGLLLIVMPTSSLVLTRTENFHTERIVRWSILGLAAALFLLWYGSQPDTGTPESGITHQDQSSSSS